MATTDAASPSTILIVDDDLGMRNLLEALLDNAGFGTLSAHDGRSAVELLAANRDSVQACLLDLNLDDCQGEELYDRLIQIKPSLAVFPMSGLYHEEIHERFKGRSFVQVIPKPFQSRQLIQALSEGLMQRRREAP